MPVVCFRILFQTKVDMKIFHFVLNEETRFFNSQNSNRAYSILPNLFHLRSITSHHCNYWTIMIIRLFEEMRFPYTIQHTVRNRYQLNPFFLKGIKTFMNSKVKIKINKNICKHAHTSDWPLPPITSEIDRWTDIHKWLVKGELLFINIPWLSLPWVGGRVNRNGDDWTLEQ